MPRPSKARAKILALIVASGTVHASEAATVAGCSPSYARRILRSLEGEGLRVRAHTSESVQAQVWTALLETGGAEFVAAEIASAAGCSVQATRKEIARLAGVAPVLGAARVVDRSRASGGGWLCRVSDAGARWLRASLEREGEGEAERLADLETDRLEVEAIASFDLF